MPHFWLIFNVALFTINVDISDYFWFIQKFLCQKQRPSALCIMYIFRCSTRLWYAVGELENSSPKRFINFPYKSFFCISGKLLFIFMIIWWCLCNAICFSSYLFICYFHSYTVFILFSESSSARNSPDSSESNSLPFFLFVVRSTLWIWKKRNFSPFYSIQNHLIKKCSQFDKNM